MNFDNSFNDHHVFKFQKLSVLAQQELKHIENMQYSIFYKKFYKNEKKWILFLYYFRNLPS